MSKRTFLIVYLFLCFLIEMETYVEMNISSSVSDGYREAVSPVTGGLSVCPQVDCYDHHISGSHDLIGSFKTTLAEMQTGTHISPVSFLCVRVCFVFDSNSINKTAVIY